MSRFAYVNGAYMAHHDASVHIEDRGYQFADGVYEVVYLHKGKLIDMAPHLDRLEYSLSELAMGKPMSRAALVMVIEELVRKNRLKTGLIYIQVTRGVAKRDFPFPLNALPSLVMTARRCPAFTLESGLKKLKVMTAPDIRWQRCDIKTVSLLAASLTKQNAIDAGYDDAWMLDGDGCITEGTSNNAWIVTKDGKLQTRPPGNDILNGITRRAILALAERDGIDVIEKPFSLKDALEAKEAFITSASACIKPVVQINETPIGNGDVGIISHKIAELYDQHLNEVRS